MIKQRSLMMYRFNRIISTVIAACFLLNTACADYAMALAPADRISGLEGIEAKDIIDIKLWTAGALKSMQEKGLAVTLDNLKKFDRIPGNTIFTPKDARFYIDEAVAVEDGLLRVMVRKTDGFRGSRTYYIELSKTGIADVYPKGKSKKREEKDLEAMARYEQHEEIVDAFIAERIKAGDSIDISRRTEDLKEIADHLVEYLGGNINDVFNGKKVVAIRVPNSVGFPVIKEGGVDIAVKSHSSNNAIYLFLKEGVDYDSLAGTSTRPLMIDVIAEYEIIHEIGVIYGLPFAVKNGRLVNELDQLYKLYVSKDIGKDEWDAFWNTANQNRGLLKRPIVDLDTNLDTRDYAAGKVNTDTAAIPAVTNGMEKPEAAELLVYPTAAEAARYAARVIANHVTLNPNTVLGLATGGTAIPVYEELIKITRAEKIDWSGVTTFNLDEYVGIPKDHPESYRNFMNRNLFNALIPFGLKLENTHVPDAAAKDPQAEMDAYVEAIKKGGGVKLWLLGIGSDGHFGFLEPAVEIGIEECKLFDPHSMNSSLPLMRKIASFNDFMMLKELGSYDSVMNAVNEVLVTQLSIRLDLDKQEDLVSARIAAAKRGGKDIDIVRAKQEMGRLGHRMLTESEVTFYVHLDKAEQEKLRAGLRKVNPDMNITVRGAEEYFGNLGKVVSIAVPTIIDNSRYFDDINDVPLKALTSTGIVRKSGMLIQVITGKGKQDALMKTMALPATAEVPSTVLKSHPDYTIIADVDAAQRPANRSLDSKKAPAVTPTKDEEMSGLRPNGVKTAYFGWLSVDRTALESVAANQTQRDEINEAVSFALSPESDISMKEINARIHGGQYGLLTPSMMYLDTERFKKYIVLIKNSKGDLIPVLMIENREKGVGEAVGVVTDLPEAFLRNEANKEPYKNLAERASYWGAKYSFVAGYWKAYMKQQELRKKYPQYSALSWPELYEKAIAEGLEESDQILNVLLTLNDQLTLAEVVGEEALKTMVKNDLNKTGIKFFEAYSGLKDPDKKVAAKSLVAYLKKSVETDSSSQNKILRSIVSSLGKALEDLDSLEMPDTSLGSDMGMIFANSSELMTRFDAMMDKKRRLEKSIYETLSSMAKPEALALLGSAAEIKTGDIAVITANNGSRTFNIYEDVRRDGTIQVVMGNSSEGFSKVDSDRASIEEGRQINRFEMLNIGAGDANVIGELLGQAGQIIMDIRSMVEDVKAAVEMAANAKVIADSSAWQGQYYDYIIPEEFASKDDSDAYKRRFDITTYGGITRSDADKIIDDIIGSIKPGRELNTIALVPQPPVGRFTPAHLERLNKAGIRFVLIELGDVLDFKASRSKDKDVRDKMDRFKEDTYAAMELVRFIDDNTIADPLIRAALSYYLKSHFGFTEKMAAEDYIEAIRIGKVDELIKGYVAYRVFERYDAIKEHRTISHTLIFA